MIETKTIKRAYSLARKKANEKWTAEHARKIGLTFMTETDADILEQLDKQPSKIAYLRRLIREDIAREREK